MCNIFFLNGRTERHYSKDANLVVNGRTGQHYNFHDGKMAQWKMNPYSNWWSLKPQHLFVLYIAFLGAFFKLIFCSSGFGLSRCFSDFREVFFSLSNWIDHLKKIPCNQCNIKESCTFFYWFWTSIHVDVLSRLWHILYIHLRDSEFLFERNIIIK